MDAKTLEMMRRLLDRPDAMEVALKLIETHAPAPPVQPTVFEKWDEFAAHGELHQANWQNFRYLRWTMLGGDPPDDVKKRKKGKREHPKAILKIRGKETAIGDLPWDQCDGEVMEVWRAWRKGQGTQPTTRDREAQALQAMFSWHLERNRIPHNPLKNLRLERRPGSVRREGYFTDMQFDSISAVMHPTLAKMALVSYRTGMRRGEIRLLERGWMDWDARLIVIPAEVAKNDKGRKVPTPDDVYELLKAQASTAPGSYLIPSPSDPSGGPCPEGTLNTWWERARDKVAFKLEGERPTFHHLRHSFAVHMLMKRAPQTWIMQVGGWTDPAAFECYVTIAGMAMADMRSVMNQRVSHIQAFTEGDMRSLMNAPAPSSDRHGPQGAQAVHRDKYHKVG